MEEGKVKNNKWLIILFCVFGLAIVGLTVGIVVVNFNKPEVAENESSDGENDELSQAEIMWSMGEEFFGGNNNRYDEAMAYFDDLGISATDEEEWFTVESIRIEVLLEYGFYNEAIKYTDNLSVNNLPDIQLYNVYSFYNRAYQGIGDDEKGEEYANKLVELGDKLDEELFNENDE